MKKKQDISIFNSERLASLIFCIILNKNGGIHNERIRSKYRNLQIF